MPSGPNPSDPNPLPPPPPVALVTGASSGIGRGIAVRLAREGWAVGLAARRQARLEEVAGDIRDCDGGVSVHVCDVAEPEQVRSAVAECRTALGPVELLVANAGVALRASPADLDAEEVERLFRVNFFGAVHAVEAVLPEMLRRRSGHLVAVASLAGFGGLRERAAYGASKAAMIAFFESLRLDLASQGVAVTVANPGFVRTEMTERDDRPRPFIIDADPAVDRIYRAVLARRPSVSFPWQVASAAALARSFPRRVYDLLAKRVPG